MLRDANDDANDAGDAKALHSVILPLKLDVVISECPLLNLEECRQRAGQA